MPVTMGGADPRREQPTETGELNMYDIYWLLAAERLRQLREAGELASRAAEMRGHRNAHTKSWRRNRAALARSLSGSGSPVRVARWPRY
jgi:hypothetical protein